jgi:hypothetical protein
MSLSGTEVGTPSPARVHTGFREAGIVVIRSENLMTDGLLPHETRLEGQWVSRKGKTKPDAVSERIARLVRNSLVRVAPDATGWDILYRDPRDGRLWELIYPHSEMHGGGPPLLRVVSIDEAHSKYRT